LPSQVEPAVEDVVPAGQVAAAQEVPLAYFWQAPAWHLPLVPQLAAPMSLHIPDGSTFPVATLVHVPSVPASAHDWQAPLHALSQQKPCAQNPLLHWLPVEHEAPLLARPHELIWHRFGDTHCTSALQATKHLLPLQVNGAQGRAGGVTQRPAPSQVETGV
jgi:hypothetical protein